MDFHSLREQYKPLFERHWLPIALGILGLIFFIYGLIALFGAAKTPSGDVVFETGSDSSDTGVASASAIGVKNSDLQVDIEGAVVSPGVYHLSSGARVKDALIAASGLSAAADRDWVTKNLNLAAKLSDGAKIYIFKVGDNNQNLVNAANINEAKINLNSASEQELDTLPGVGPATADKIIKLRPYQEINDLLAKKAVSNRVFEQIKDKITAY